MQSKRSRGIAYQLTSSGQGWSTQKDWMCRASLLRRSYKVLIREARAGDRKLRVLSPTPNKTEEVAGREKVALFVTLERQQLLLPAAMLAGMSIECYFKALSAQGAPAPRGHNLAKLAAEVGFALTKDEAIVLDQLTEMIQLGRYAHTTSGNANLTLSSTKVSSLLLRVAKFADEMA